MSWQKCDISIIISLISKLTNENKNLFNVVAALDLLARLDGADGDSNGDQNDGEVFRRFVASTEVVHSSQHVGYQGSLKEMY